MTTKEFRLGLIGWPLKHSFSPKIHQAALKSLGLGGDYLCFPINPMPKGDRELNDVLDRMRSGELQGLNVTLPHKERVIDKLDRLTMTAGKIGAVNTVFSDGKALIGDNTDRDAFLLDLQRNLAPERGNALVLGAGGAARAVVSGLNEEGWKVWVAARRISHARILAEALEQPGKSAILPIPLDSEILSEVAPVMSLIVNATSAGMSPNIDVSPWPEEISFPEGACVYDLVYTPQHTQLARQARSDGLRVATGLGMLVEQAALALERWTGRSAPRSNASGREIGRGRIQGREREIIMPLRYLTAGESHGPVLTAIIEGLPAGLELPSNLIDEQLLRRQQGYGAGPRMKIERDSVRILSGLMEGVTIGSPITMEIENKDYAKWEGVDVPPFTTPRPGHADLAGAIKYGYRDLRPSLERASARETAARVAVGALCRHLLAQFDIEIGGYVRSVGEITADVDAIDLIERARIAEENDVHAPDLEAAAAMRSRIRQIMEERDTLGGIIEIFAIGLPPGLGSHVQWDRRLDARLGGAVLGVQAMKGVEFGPAFENTRRRGTEVHDAILLNGENLVRATNNAGGLEGGMTNGQPVLIRVAMKPIATTLTPQQTVDLASGEQVPTQYERSDFCPVPRAVPILEAAVAFVLADALLEKLGGDSMGEIQPRYEMLRKARLSDLKMDGLPHEFWPEEEV